MRRRVFGHAGVRGLRGVGDQLISRFSRERRGRRRYAHCRSRLLFFEFHDAAADENPVEDDPDADNERDYPGHPHAAKDLRVAWRLLIRHNLEEESQEDHQADADEACDDAALDLIEPLLFGRDAAPPFPLLLGEEHVRHPGLTPIELFSRGARLHPFASAMQIDAALPAEFEIIGDLKTTLWTEHSHSSFYLRQSVSRPRGEATNSGKCAVVSSVTLAPLDGDALATS